MRAGVLLAGFASLGPSLAQAQWGRSRPARRWGAQQQRPAPRWGAQPATPAPAAPATETAPTRQPPARAIRIYGYATGGFSGELVHDSNSDRRYAMLVNLGGGLGGEYVFDEYFFAVGLRAGFLSWKAVEGDYFDRRAAALDISAAPRVRYALGPLEIYGILTVGLTLSWLPDVIGRASGTGVGGHVGLSAGLSYLDGPVGFFVEAGWSHHGVDHGVPISDGRSSGVTFHFHQPVANAGVLVGF